MYIVTNCSGWYITATSDECDSCARLVDLPNVEPLILIQALIKLVRRATLGQDTLACLNKLDGVGIRHFTNDTVNGINGPHTPNELTSPRDNKYHTV